MSVTVNVKIEDIATEILTYTQIKLESASAVDGSYSVVSTTTLVAGTVYYAITDAAGGITTWYRYRLYNTTGPVASGYSNPFQPTGVSRLRLREKVLVDYHGGHLLVSTSGGSASSILTLDYRVKTEAYRATRGAGTWIKVTSGTHINEVTRVTAINKTTGAIAVSPSLTGALADGDTFEWLWMDAPEEIDACINRALLRYKYLDRVPIVGTGLNEQSLSYIPDLYAKRFIVGLWQYPTVNSSSSPLDIERPWSSYGNWWNTREEGGVITLITRPAIPTSQTLYLEYLRPMPPLYTDTSILPNACQLDLAAALAYDEVLAGKSRPSSTGASTDRSIWAGERVVHRPELRRLLRQYGAKPRYQFPELSEPVTVDSPWSAR